MMTKKNIFMVVLAIVIYLLAQQGKDALNGSSIASESAATVQDAYAARQSDVQIHGTGIVKKVLPDDRKGLQHQKFILQIDSGQTLLVAHNIDVAPRLPGLKKVIPWSFTESTSGQKKAV